MPTLPLRSNCLQVTGKCLGNAACTRLAAPILAGMRFWEHIAHLAPFLRILKRDNLWHTARDWWHASAPFPHPAHQTGRADFAHRLSDRDSLGFAHGRLVLSHPPMNWLSSFDDSLDRNSKVPREACFGPIRTESPHRTRTYMPRRRRHKPHDEDEAVDNEDLTWTRLKAAKSPEKK